MDARTPAPLDPLVEEQKALKRTQKGTENEAMQIAKEAMAYMMALGWRFDAGVREMKDENGKIVDRSNTLVIRPLSLGEWQDVQKEKLRRSLT